MKSEAPGVQPFTKLPSVKDAERAHQSKMENNNGGSSESSSQPEAKISPTQYPGKA